MLVMRFADVQYPAPLCLLWQFAAQYKSLIIIIIIIDFTFCSKLIKYYIFENNNPPLFFILLFLFMQTLFCLLSLFNFID